MNAETIRKAKQEEIGMDSVDHYVTLEENHELSKSLKSSHAFADVVVEARFSPEEREMFARIIRQFNTLYWEAAMQTWQITDWRGVPVLKPPTDMWIYQELITKIKPTVIIETGTWAGGSALFMRDVMKLNNQEGTIITIDITEERFHPLFKDILQASLGEDELQQILWMNGRSISEEVVEAVKCCIDPSDRVMVILDSDHSYENVSKELECYAPLVTKGSVLVIEDTSNCPDALRAVQDWYFENRGAFKMDVTCEKFMLTFSRDGFYERIV